MLRLGMVGFSEGNGHPYSWSALFNGFDSAAMAHCPYPVIPAYLKVPAYPEAFLTHKGRVVCLWDASGVHGTMAEDVARCARIDRIAATAEEMIRHVDAVLLATDDGGAHASLGIPFLEAGLPLLIDKPLALSVQDVLKLQKAQKAAGQLLSYSSLRFAEAFSVPEAVFQKGLIKVTGFTPKLWDTYAMHLIDPLWDILLRYFRDFEEKDPLKHLKTVRKSLEDSAHEVCYTFDTGLTVRLTATGDDPDSLGLVLEAVSGDGHQWTGRPTDTFRIFHQALCFFADRAAAWKGNLFGADEARRQYGTVELLERGR